MVTVNEIKPGKYELVVCGQKRKIKHQIVATEITDETKKSIWIKKTITLIAEK